MCHDPPAENADTAALGRMPDQECGELLLRAGGWAGARKQLRADRSTMGQLTAFRARTVDAVIAELARQYGFAWEALGSSHLESDYDITITTHGTDRTSGGIVYDFEIVRALNDTIQRRFGLQPGTIFDTNVYASAPLDAASALPAATQLTMGRVVEEGQDIRPRQAAAIHVVGGIREPSRSTTTAACCSNSACA